MDLKNIMINIRNKIRYLLQKIRNRINFPGDPMINGYPEHMHKQAEQDIKDGIDLYGSPS